MANNRPAELLIPNKLYALEKLEDRVTRFNQFETVLSNENLVEEDDDDDTIPEIFNNLKKHMSQELLLCWDIVTLEKYVAMNRIPRGLRMRKFPTFARDDDLFINKWNDTLSRCSFELMALIINHKKQDLIATRENINESQLLLSSLEKLPDLSDLDKKLKEHLSSLEQTVSSRKKKKLNRDRMDYENNAVYVWRRPKSILRPKNYQHDCKKTVSFSSDSGEETSFCTDDMMSLRQNRRTPTPADLDDVDSMEGTRKPKNYHGKDQYTNRKKSRRKEIGVSVLSKGLSFAPTHHFSLFNTLLDVNKFVRKLTLRRHFGPGGEGVDIAPHRDYSTQLKAHGTTEQAISLDTFKEHACLADLCALENESVMGKPPDESLIGRSVLNKRFNSGFYPLQSRCPSMDLFQDLVEQDLKKLNTKVPLCKKWNISLEERKALESLKAATDITIRQADKGGSVVVLNTTDYIAEAKRQLNDT
ncbi:hypothetical protein XELAEV_18005509mg [Xenopus laevis]|uniref:Uncharacterized protein n=1 Tax=Xenopus laevis TaxID=8355 RepID=A0A974DXD9_XENLA|nr:hypothetical protein XELAEV_18005509mg [Xenopus laevis]